MRYAIRCLAIAFAEIASTIDHRKKLLGNGTESARVIPQLWVFLSPFGPLRQRLRGEQRGIKGDFKIMLRKSPLAPLFQRGV